MMEERTYDTLDLNYNPMNDVLFKFVFGNEKRKQITIDFLNTVLQKSLDHPIVDLTFAPTEQNPEHEGDKLTRLDVACVLDSGEQVDVEVQVVNEHDMSSRTLYYWSQMYMTSLVSGETYHDLKPCITVNILNFTLLPKEDPHSTYGVCELETGHRLNRDLELHFLEIPKYAKAPQKPISELTKMERWLAYFANQLNSQEKEELAMSDAAIKEAMDAAKIFLSNTAGRRAYINRQMAIMDRQSQLEAAHDKGIQEGLQQGMQQGLQQGESKMGKLMAILAEENKFQDISKAAVNPKYREELYKKYNIE